MLERLTQLRARRRAARHARDAMKSDLVGRTHDVVQLRHPEHGILAIACVCGEVYYCAAVFQEELVKPGDYDDPQDYARALRRQFHVDAVAKDVSAKRARKLHGKPAKPQGPGWFS